MVCKWECQNVTVRDWWCKMHSQCCQSWPQSAKMYAAQPDIQDSWCALAFAHDFTEVTSYKLTSNNCKIKKKKNCMVYSQLYTHTHKQKCSYPLSFNWKYTVARINELSHLQTHLAHISPGLAVMLKACWVSGVEPCEDEWEGVWESKRMMGNCWETCILYLFDQTP